MRATVFASLSALMAATPLLGGCYMDLQAGVSGPLAAPVISAREISDDEVCILNLAVSAHYPGQGASVEVWRIETPTNERCLDIRQVTYGQAPQGFVQTTPPAPLEADRTYRVHVASFAISDTIFVRFVDGAWRVIPPGPDGVA